MEKVSDRKNWVRGSCIGKGSYGSVSVAVDKSDGEVFAVKSVDVGSCLSSQLDALENEIHVLRSISSPFVVGYLGDDVTQEGGDGLGTTSFRNLHLEYLPGGTVADFAKRSGEGILRSYTWCIVSALRCLHSKGFAHCDVKGRNVLVGSTPGVAKLADFGSAVAVVKTGDGSISTAMMPRGSPLWMAPEVVRREYQGPESDVWSLGCTVIEMATGKPGWKDCGADTLCRIGFSNQLPEFPAQLSELGQDFLGKCLRREPSKRWTCDQLLQHPFISSSSPASTITHPSPRCVLDRFNSELSESEDEGTSDAVAIWDSKSRNRIGKLASQEAALWELSDGWTVVRDSTNDKNEEKAPGASHRREEREGQESEEGNHGVRSEYSDSIEIRKENGRTARELKDSAESEHEPNDVVVPRFISQANNSCCKIFLFSQNLHPMYNNHRNSRSRNNRNDCSDFFYGMCINFFIHLSPIKINHCM